VYEAICFLTFGKAWPRRVSIALAIALILQAVFLVK